MEEQCIEVVNCTALDYAKHRVDFVQLCDQFQYYNVITQGHYVIAGAGFTCE